VEDVGAPPKAAALLAGSASQPRCWSPHCQCNLKLSCLGFDFRHQRRPLAGGWPLVLFEARHPLSDPTNGPAGKFTSGPQAEDQAVLQARLGVQGRSCRRPLLRVSGAELLTLNMRRPSPMTAVESINNRQEHCRGAVAHRRHSRHQRTHACPT